MTLNYSTDRTPGWKVDETIEIPIVGATIPPRLKGIQLTIDVAGEKIEKRWCDPNFPTTGATTCKDYPLITPNIGYAFRWDGKDAYDRTVQGRVTATIQVIYVYEFNYYGATGRLRRRASASSARTREVFDGRYSCGNRSGTMDTHFFCGVPVGQTITRAIGSWDARPTDGLGGWSLCDHHAYDPVERALHRGDGSALARRRSARTTRTVLGGSRAAMGSPAAEGKPATAVNPRLPERRHGSPDGTTFKLSPGLGSRHFRAGADGKLRRFAGKYSTATEPTANRDGVSPPSVACSAGPPSPLGGAISSLRLTSGSVAVEYLPAKRGACRRPRHGRCRAR